MCSRGHSASCNFWHLLHHVPCTHLQRFGSGVCPSRLDTRLRSTQVCPHGWLKPLAFLQKLIVLCWNKNGILVPVTSQRYDNMCSKHSGSQHLRQCVCVQLVSVCNLCLCATCVCVQLVSVCHLCLCCGAARYGCRLLMRLPFVDAAAVA